MRVSRPLLTLAFALLGSTAALAEGDKDEIRIGQTLPYSGPASGFGIIGRAQEAYFEKINAEGGYQRPQDQVHQPRRRVLAAQDGRADAKSSSNRRKCC
jgi:hypothetical protein